jgi:PAS domain S-box-containing protein
MPEDPIQARTDTIKENDSEFSPADRLNELMNISSDGLYDWNIQTREISLSGKLLESLGYKADEITDLHNFWFSIIHTDDLVFLKKIIDEYNNGQRNSHEHEYRVMTKSGEWRWIFSNGRLIKRDADGKPVRIIGLHSDITERKSTAVRLAESEEKFSKVFQTGPDPSAITTIEEGRFIEVNEAFIHTIGFSREEVINKKTSELGTWDPPKQRDLIKRLIKENGFFKDLEVTAHKKNGEIIYGLFSASVIHLGTGPVLYSVFKDITNRKLTLDRLRIQKDLSYSLAGTTDLKELGEQVLAAAIQIEGIDSGGFYIFDDETGKLNLIAHKGHSASFIQNVSSYDPDSPQMQVIAKGECLYLTHLELKFRRFDMHVKEGLKLVIIRPIKYENKVIANLNLASHTHESLSPEIIDSVEAIISMLGESIARVQAEIYYRRLNARMRAMVESPKEISMFSLDRNYCYTSFNNNHKDVMLAVNKTEICNGINFLDIIKYSPERYKAAKEDFDKVLRGESFSRIISRNGAIYEFTFNPVLEESENIIGISCFIQNITKRKKAEDALRESESMLKQSQKIARIGNWSLDLRTMQGSYSDDLVEYFGPDIKDFNVDFEKFVNNVIHPDYRENVFSAFKELLNERKLVSMECRLVDFSGKSRYVWMEAAFEDFDENGNPLKVYGIIQDITERKLAEEVLQESNLLLEAQFKSSPDAILIVDHNSRIVNVNRSHIDNLPVEKYIGANAIEILPIEARELARQKHEQCFATGEPQQFEHGLRDGRWVSARVVRLTRKGKPPQLMIISTDVTERKQALDILRIQKDISIALAGISDLHELAEIVFDSVMLMEGIDFCGFYIRDTMGGFRPIAHRGLSKSFLKHASGFVSDLFQTRIISKGDTIYVPYEKLNSPEFKVANKEGYKFIFIIPINYENTVTAYLNVSSRTKLELSKWARDGLETIAGTLGNSIARVRNEIAVREINARLKAVIESSHDTSIFSLDRDCRLTSFNKNFGNHIRIMYNKEIKIGMDFFDIKAPPKSRFAARRNFQKVLKGEFIESYFKGYDKIFEISMSPILEENGKIIGISCFIRDITEKKLSEKALLESEKKFSTIIETASEGIIIANITDYKLIYCNSMICTMLGYSEEELLQKTVNDIHPEKSILAIIPHFKALAHGRIKMVPAVPLLRKDGTVFYANISASTITIEGTDYLAGFFTDITERKMAVDLLAIQKDLSVSLTGAIELNELGDIVLKAAVKLDRIDSGSFHIRNTETGEFSLICHTGHAEWFIKPALFFAPDDPVLQIISKGEPQFKTFQDSNLPEDDIHIKEGIKFTFKIPIKHENKIVAVLILASHTHYELTETLRASILAIAGIAGDSVSRILLESETRDLNARIKSIIDSPKDINIYSLDPNYCFTSFNESFKKSMNEIYTIDIKIGMNALDLFITQELRSQALNDFNRALKGESFSKVVKLQSLLYDFNISPIFDDKHKVTGISCFGRDITEQKNLEEKLRQSEKMEAIGQLAGGIAHDFNNELSIISGYTELLRDEIKTESDAKGYIDGILSGIKRSANLISQMLAFSRKGKFLSISVNIHDIIAEIVIMLKHSIDKRIIILQDLKADPPTTRGDPTQLKSAILNLALNARDAMPDGGELLFTTDIIEITEDTYKNAPYYINLGTYVRISVSDTGIGMDKKTQSRLFEPFFTTKGKGRGTGFGLASVYGTVKNHNGIINVYSEPGYGSTFKIYLPAEEISIPEVKTETESVKTIKLSASILLVDDEDDLRIVGEKLLTKFGYKVNICKDGREAVKFYKKHWQQIDLVILDMIMPVMNGKDAFIAMKNINPDIKALLTSGYSLNGEAQAILDKGVKGFLQKPFKIEELSGKIIQVLKSTDISGSKAKHGVKKSSD